MAERLTVRGTSALVAAVLIAGASLSLRAQSTAPPATQTPPSPSPSGQAPDVYTIGRNRVTPPKVVTEVRPTYTAEAMRARIQGVVRLRGIVERDGTISNIEVRESLDATNGLDQSAIDALKQWRFQPGTLDGNPVRVMVSVDLRFVLRDSAPEQGAWPTGFAAAPSPASAVEERAETQGLQVKIARPADWNARREGAPNEWFGMRSPNGRQFVIVTRPDPATFELRWPVAPAAVESITESVRRAQPTPDAEAIGSGQVQTPAALYVWSALRLPTAPTPSGISPDQNPFGEARAWMFTRTVNGKVVGVFCMLLVPRGLDPAALDTYVRAAAAEFSPIVNSVTIEPISP